jgi:hypothetical protein
VVLIPVTVALGGDVVLQPVIVINAMARSFVIRRSNLWTRIFVALEVDLVSATR